MEIQNLQDTLSVLAHRVALLEKRETEHSDDLENIKNALASINTKLDKQASFVGGIVFIISCLWGFFLTFKESVISLFSR